MEEWHNAYILSFRSRRNLLGRLLLFCHSDIPLFCHSDKGGIHYSLQAKIDASFVGMTMGWVLSLPRRRNLLG